MGNDKPKGRGIVTVYDLLLNHFGPQGWWPITPTHSLVPVYGLKQAQERLNENEQFEICLGAILTQNTNWGNVVKVLSLLKSHKLLQFRSVLSLPLRKLEYFCRSSGYFRQKARRVKGFLRIVQNDAAGRFSKFLQGELFDVRQKLLAISGIGPETADSMLLYAAGRPIFVVDAYTRRVGSRVGFLGGKESYDEVQDVFRSALKPDVHVIQEYHALIVRLGKDICRKKPNCKICPLLSMCRTGKKTANSRRTS